jgi:hypothetical protein
MAPRARGHFGSRYFQYFEGKLYISVGKKSIHWGNNQSIGDPFLHGARQHGLKEDAVQQKSPE